MLNDVFHFFTWSSSIHLRASRRRGVRTYKAYIVVIVSFAARADHLQAASGYSTADFLFVSRLFVVRPIFRLIVVPTFLELWGRFFAGLSLKCFNRNAPANAGTKWRFNPPGAPHFGGLCKAAVRRMKLHLKRFIGNVSLTAEELSPVLAKI